MKKISVAEVLGGKVIATVPFRFNGIKQCEAIAAMPISFNFLSAMLDCMHVCLGIKSFDLFGIPGFSKKFLRESKTIYDTFDLVSDKHRVKRIVLFQHVDFHNEGGSTRFITQAEEDLHHKGGLIESRKKIVALYPGTQVTMVYARIVNNETEIQLSQIYEDGSERVIMIAPYFFKGINKCEVSGIFCLDFRFRFETRNCIKAFFGVPAMDIIGLPGSAKNFLDGRNVGWKAIKISVEKHGCKKIAVMHHADCGAYGGFARFGDPIAEELFHRKELQKIRTEMLRRYPHIEVALMYARLINNQSQIQFVLVD